MHPSSRSTRAWRSTPPSRGRTAGASRPAAGTPSSVSTSVARSPRSRAARPLPQGWKPSWGSWRPACLATLPSGTVTRWRSQHQNCLPCAVSPRSLAVSWCGATHERIATPLRTKIVATIGPATSERDTVHALPKIRIGALPTPVDLADKSHVVLAPEGRNEDEELPTTYADLARDVSHGDRILLDDGLMELRVEEVRGEKVYCRVVRGGLLKQNKGMNLPGVRVSAPALTEKDLVDLEFAIAQGVDYIGLSFVQSPEDIVDLRSRIPSGVLICAKIEKDTALEAIEGILAETDAVMVARGDLGVELPFEQVPVAQKRIIQFANLYGRPVITATQMLESMIEHPRPTRAE